MTMELFVDPRSETVMSAVLSADGVYRYVLSRSWGTGDLMAWVMLNPSTADAEVDDPTIRRCMGFARRERCDGIVVLNLYALRATKPRHLVGHPDPEGPDNAAHWCEELGNHRISHTVAAWGALAAMPRLPAPRGLRAVQDARIGWECLGTTKDGHPRHPLYVAGDTPLVPL